MGININRIETIKLTDGLLQHGIRDWIDGKIHHDKNHRIRYCFFIVNTIEDAGYISELAHFLLTTGCRNYDFYGEYAYTWEFCFDDADIEMHPNVGHNDVALTGTWEEMEKFTEALEIAAVDSYDNEADPVILLFYDDDTLLTQILDLLKSWIEDLDDDE